MKLIWESKKFKSSDGINLTTCIIEDGGYMVALRVLWEKQTFFKSATYMYHILRDNISSIKDAKDEATGFYELYSDGSYNFNNSRENYKNLNIN